MDRTGIRRKQHPNQIRDSDGTTSIRTMQNGNEDAIRFRTNGEERLVMDDWWHYVKNDLYKTAIGDSALYSNTTGDYNTASRSKALYSNATGHSNTARGVSALSSNTSGYHRTALGYSANNVGNSYNNNTGLGSDADYSASNQVRIGNTDVTSIGGQVGWTTLSDGQFKKSV